MVIPPTLTRHTPTPPSPGSLGGGRGTEREETKRRVKAQVHVTNYLSGGGPPRPRTGGPRIPNSAGSSRGRVDPSTTRSKWRGSRDLEGEKRISVFQKPDKKVSLEEKRPSETLLLSYMGGGKRTGGLPRTRERVGEDPTRPSHDRGVSVGPTGKCVSRDSPSTFFPTETNGVSTLKYKKISPGVLPVSPPALNSRLRTTLRP